eukprot:CAMPEP_0197547062 /NCGR_PEP_ID=MMETSP1320-20131121/1493_1 /TAXON_ID=91990 /ORGANISM="Bolidomonas sp., Strain RCC2347" /LENGTH=1081 /DNA_ID=CAMNT_0043106757 /DNA_START=39 /DNA_END=3281 /DNA_ORIENTATION=+
MAENVDPQAAGPVSGPVCDSPRFHKRCSDLIKQIGKYHAEAGSPKPFGEEDGSWTVAVCRGGSGDGSVYYKSTILHLYLFGYELPDTLLLISSDRKVTVLTTKKKIEFLKSLQDKRPKDSDLEVSFLQKNKADGNASNFGQCLAGAHGDNLGHVDPKGREEGVFAEGWTSALKSAGKSLSDVTSPISLVMSVKDQSEHETMKKAAVLTNKIFKLSFIPKMESVIDEGRKVSHEAIADHVEEAIQDPSKVKLKVPPDDVESCFTPIIQSGGDYSLKVSAASSSSPLSFDVIIASVGARYQSYCASMTRTYMVDPPPLVTATYDLLVDVQNACMDVMRPGNPLSNVRRTAVQTLKEKGREDLVKLLPKNLGFAMGLDYRDSELLLNDKNPILFRANMVFCLHLGFQNVPLTADDLKGVSPKADVSKLRNFSVAVADTYRIRAIDIDSGDNGPELFTKATKNGTEVVYEINTKEEDESSDSDGGSIDGSDSGSDAPKGSEADADGKRKSSRLAADKDAKADVVESAVQRAQRQMDLLRKKNEQRLREIARKNRGGEEEEEEEEAQELECYGKGEDMPASVLPNQVTCDMAKECVIVPISGTPVPFHISTIKSVVMPDPDRATYLRINFHSGGAAIGKDVPANMAKLIERHSPFATFIKELTFRSLTKANLEHSYRQINELRKRARQREQKEAEESNLVAQEKLRRSKEGKVPRLSDLTMRPALGKGRKTIGTLEAHENGLRFRSNKGDSVDIIYQNIKNALFQPCDNELMVLIHFNLKNPIMVGQKKHANVQFYTEVVEASEQVDTSRRSMYDPDEMDQEQRERQLRKRLNEAFKDFCKKVENTMNKAGSKKEFDIPYRDLGFHGTPNKEMCFIMPTLNCLVNLTESPPFLVDLSMVDHVHFERVNFTSKAFDIVIVNKDFSKQPWRVDMIPNTDKDNLQNWLTDMDIPYTEGPMALNWKQIMAEVVQDDRFYLDTEEDEVTPKPAGWGFLIMDDEEEGDGDEDDDEESDYSQESEESEEMSEEGSDSGFDDESESESDYDGDEDLEEEGMDWDEMEKEAMVSDKKRAREAAEQERKERGNAKK